MIRLYLGRKERGKTTLAAYMVGKLPRRVLFDPRGMIRRPGAAVARTADAFQRGMDALADDDFAELVYTPSDNLRAAWLLFAGEVRRWVDRHPTRDLGVLVDEITFVDVMADDFEWSLKCCRADHIHFFLTCHRPADVPVPVRALADYWYLFAAHQEHDLNVIKERCSPETAALVGSVSGSEFVCWDDRRGALSQHRDPSAWFTNLRPGPPLPAPFLLD